MENQEHRHEIVRFRREEIARWDSYPSAVSGRPPVVGPRRRIGLGRTVFWAIALVLLLVATVPAAFISIGVPQFVQDQARVQVEAVLSRMAGVGLVTELGEPILSIDRSRFLALSVDDISIASAETGKPIVEAGTLRLGLRLLPMLRGQLQLASASIEDARVHVDRMPTSGNASLLDRLRGPDGLIEPELVTRSVYDTLHRLMDGLALGSTRSISLSNIDILMPSDAELEKIHVDTGAVTNSRSGALTVNAKLQADGHAISFDGTAERDLTLQRIASFNATLALAEGRLWTVQTPPPSRRGYAAVAVDGGMKVQLSGSEAVQGPARLGIGAEISGFKLTYNNGTFLQAAGRINVSVDPSSRKFEVEPSELRSGSSQFVFHGAVGPQSGEDGAKAGYRFELVSDGSKLAPSISREPAITAYARAAGHFYPDLAQLVATEIAVRTDRGAANADAKITFDGAKSPGVEFRLLSGDMPVAYAKQIWPWFAAPPARIWVHNNLFGGNVSNSRINLSVLPGRLGDGIPLSAEEFSGHFDVEGTRFDLAGQLPAVREGAGSVELAGPKATIKLASGRLYLPEDRIVDVADGTLDIARGDRKYVGGDLDIQVSGKADAVAALAAYEPINALRQTSITAGDLKGQVRGQVKAHIPFDKLFETDRTWNVALEFQNLSIAKPIDGQSITDAGGKIDIGMAVATVEAKVRMNGMPATLSLREPIGEDKSSRKRDIAVELDDKTRNAIAPSLAAFLSGPVGVKISDNGDRRAISADLGSARVSIPWIGWTKGAGVPANLAFSMTGSGDDFRLSDMRLTGKSFSLSGSAVIAQGQLSEASFPTVSLNRNDSVSVQIKRAGGGYNVTVRGDSLDARALIKQALSDRAHDADGRGKPIPVSVNANVAYVTGFGGESLSNVKISYQGTGSRGGTLDLSASTRAGGGLSVSDKTADGRRSVVMRSLDAGAVVRFLDLYPHMQGGQISVNLGGTDNGVLKGLVDANNFTVVNEPRLRSMVSTPADGSRSLSTAVQRDIDTSRVQFDRGFARVEKGDGYLNIEDGAIRGPLLGTTFRGALYDRNGKMSISGTFMPAYGLNSLFAELPLLGAILGGRDRGLIGITYRVAGDAKAPNLQINPISAIAPGIFRQIFEFN